MSKVGLTPVPSLRIKPPRVKECPISFECVLHNTLEIGDGTQGSATLVIGRIVQAHVLKNAYQDGRILIDQIEPLSRLGGLSWGLTREVFDLPRPKL
jgi:flavin reductase (DIM6/NTAB) family NADH-FMN oxidoreductase RutF